jgi:pyruvate/2-oxoglutarate/acetoin dehydrogenase E1 component
MTYREALRMALREDLERDEAVLLMGEEWPTSPATRRT